MTQPNEYFPEEAQNFGSFSSFAAKTQTEWEDDLRIPEEQRWQVALAGTDNMKLATSDAQDSANFANTVLGTSFQSNVDGGVQMSESFNGPPAPDFGANWTYTTQYTGGGTYGPNGLGRAAWVKSGGLSRAILYRHVQETVGDFQAVQILLRTLPEDPGTDQPALNYLRARINAAQDSWIYARIGRVTVQLGRVIGGSETAFATENLIIRPGQVWRLQCGTDDGTTSNLREFVVYRNGTEVMRETDSLSNYGADYRGVGMTAEARSRAFATTQTAPGEIDVWSAADYVAV